MKTNVKDSSLDAYFDLIMSKNLQQQQLTIALVMEPEKTYTRRELSRLSGLETSTVSARVNSMIDTVIQIVGTKKDTTTGKTVEALMLKVAS